MNNGLNKAQFEDANEAEFDAEADLANVSGDENEDGMDEYEEEELTEVLPSQRRMEKELGTIHRKLERDEHNDELKRIEKAFIGDEIERAQAKKRKYKWNLAEGFAGDDKVGHLIFLEIFGIFKTGKFFRR